MVILCGYNTMAWLLLLLGSFGLEGCCVFRVYKAFGSVGGQGVLSISPALFALPSFQLTAANSFFFFYYFLTTLPVSFFFFTVGSLFYCFEPLFSLPPTLKRLFFPRWPKTQNLRFISVCRNENRCVVIWNPL